MGFWAGLVGWNERLKLEISLREKNETKNNITFYWQWQLAGKL